MITFESEDDFQQAVIQVIIDKLQLGIETRGYPFVTGVKIYIKNDYGEVLLEEMDSVV